MRVVCKQLGALLLGVSLVAVGACAAPTLTAEDEELLDEIQYRAFRYFWEQVVPDTGLVLDRSQPDAPSSIAAVGFGLAAIVIGDHHGWVEREEALDRVLTTLRTFRDDVEGKRGFYYHFVDPATGARVWDCEVSSIDTAWFLAGALLAGEYFRGDVRTLANELYERVEWTWLLDEDLTLSHGWTPEQGMLPYSWDTYSEHMLLYLLAIGSPTDPIPAESWEAWDRPAPDGYVRDPLEQLFTYQYSHAFVDFQDRHDDFANYWNNSVVATERNRLFCFANRFRYETYQENIWGISASDGPGGYFGYGAREGRHDGTVAPYAAVASLPFLPEESMAAIREMKSRYGDKIWGEYGFTSAFNVDRNWYSNEYIGIDKGIELLMVENHRTGLVWRFFMRGRWLRGAMSAAGFVHAPGTEFVLTPWYADYYELLMAGLPTEAVAPHTDTPPVIDGVLDEWAHEPEVVDERMTVPGIDRIDPEHSLSARFWAMWDDDHLYLAADVEDSILVVNMPPSRLREFYYTDSVEFYIQPGRHTLEDLGIFKLAVLPFDTEGNPKGARHEDSEPGPIDRVAPEVEIASSRTDEGYAVEVAIPLLYLGLEGVEPDTPIAFSFTVHSGNDPDAGLGEYVRTAMLAWNPVPQVWGRPETWGKLILVGPEN
ncbi:MAG: glucoamylase family protein [Candidatus Bipolaricaulota bacterium]